MKCINTIGCPSKEPDGFSLVEIIVSTLILLTAVTGSVYLYNITNRNTRIAANKNDELAAVNADLAQVLRVNDQFICSSPTSCGCMGGSCSNSNQYPGENNYIPNNYINESGDESLKTAIESICGQSGSGFAARLVSEINSLPLSTEADTLDIQRIATAFSRPAGTNDPIHLYTVTWRSSTGVILRQIALSPAIAAWCP